MDEETRIRVMAMRRVVLVNGVPGRDSLNRTPWARVMATLELERRKALDAGDACRAVEITVLKAEIGLGVDLTTVH